MSTPTIDRPVPQIVMDFLLDKAIEAMETGGTVSFHIHPRGPLCGDTCPVHRP